MKIVHLFFLLIVFTVCLVQAKDNEWRKSGSFDSPVAALAFTDEKTGYAGTKATGCFKTMDGGKNWSAIFPQEDFMDDKDSEEYTISDAKYITDINFVNAKVGYLGTVFSGVFKTTDSGETWVTANRGLILNSSNSHISDITFVNQDVGYVATDGAGVYKTTNGGIQWKAVNTNLPLDSYNSIPVQSLFFIDTQTGYAGLAEEGGIFKTTNGGQSWHPASDGLPDDARTTYALWFVDTKIGYAGLGAGIVKTTNGGKSWKAVNRGLESKTAARGFHSIVAIVFLDADAGYAVAGLGGVFKTTNGGRSWVAINDGLDNDHGFISLNALFVVNDKTIYSGGRNGVYVSAH